MSTHRAVVLSNLGDKPIIEQRLTRLPAAGQILVAPLFSPVLSYQHAVHSGERGNPLALPMVPGTAAVGRVVAVGPDATKLKAGDLVFLDATLRGRDDPGITSLQGLFRIHAALDDTWHDGSWAERFLVPLENAFKLEADAVAANGATMSQLTAIPQLVVPYGGWRTGGLRPGGVVAIAYASGAFGGAAIDVALGMGASRVVALGRRAETLVPAVRAFDKAAARPGIVVPVVLSGDPDRDAKAIRAATQGERGLDVFLDLSPAAAASSCTALLAAAVLALKPGGTLVLMGGVREPVAVPYQLVMLRNITIKGRFMFLREWVEELIALIECGSVSLARQTVQCFSLDDHERAVQAAKDDAGSGKCVALTPVIESQDTSL
ncbi:hypothetical protein HDU87_008638 [Geranomyces variabilis]|uniref:Alcohol dehydrogenase n=1 Tax=Geranomyces variabilis TaxID=109894 RepID=A0AAD5XIZ6_9FUNG|nr:hypothetical protein HDU87_008638 [Geranomyces variabilis]